MSKDSSINEAAKKLFISQPSLTASLKSLEQEVGFEIFSRTKSGISLTVKGREFLGYAKSVIEQYDILDAKYISHKNIKRTFHVSMQHYTFAVNAFVSVIDQYGMEEYEFEIHETKTHEVIENVKNQISEIGVLYLNAYNQAVLQKIFRESGVTMEELNDYPCLAFAQGESNSFYYAEEVLSTYAYKQLVRANDRATMLNLMVGINGYTLCSGIICEELNGSAFCAVKLETDEKMTIGYIARKASVMSEMGNKFLEELSKYKDKVLA